MSKRKLPKIDIGFCDGGMTEGWFTWSIMNAYAELAELGMKGIAHRTSGPILCKNRNEIVNLFLKGPNDWLFMVDTDMILDDNHIIKLWETADKENTPIVGGLAFIWTPGRMPVPNFFIENEDGELAQVYNSIPDEPFDVMSTGLATVLVHREVFESMHAPRHHERRWFDDIPSKYSNDLAGEDVSFFLRAGEAGFRVLIDPSARTGHIKDQAIGYPDWEAACKQLAARQTAGQ